MKILYITVIIVSAILIIYLISKIMKTKNKELKYFNYSEFDSPKGKSDTDKTYVKKGRAYILDSGKNNMKTDTLSKLVKAREEVEEYNKKNNKRLSFRINSGFRTESFNSELKNASPNSSHKSGYAADISTRDYSKDDITEIARALKNAGFNRFGVYETFLHVDNDPTKPANVVWYTGNADRTLKPNNL